MLIIDSGILIFLILLANIGIKLENAAAACGFNIISYVPPENRYEKYMKVSIALEYFKPGKLATSWAYCIIICSYWLFSLLNSKNTDEKHIIGNLL